MLAVNGYFDGAAFQPMEKTGAKINQRVIITILDDFAETGQEANDERAMKIKKMRGILAEYANPESRYREKGAWERAAVEKHGHI